MGRILLLAVALLFVPAAAGQELGIYNPEVSTPTTMYFHINGFQQFPINTQLPDDSYAETVDVGIIDHSFCQEDPGGVQDFTSRSMHTWYGYSSPSIVQYDVLQNGKPRIHNERGISYDVDLDESATPMFHWYMESAYPAQTAAPTQSPQPVPVPEVIVRATVREGDDISVGNAALNTGQIIAQGQSDKALLAGSLTQGNEHVTAHDLGNGRFVYEFSFPLAWGEPSISKEESFNIRVDAFIEEPYCDGPGGSDADYAMFDFVLVHTSPEYRPRLGWSVMNPLYIEALHPQFVGDDLVIHTASNSPWGSYDVHGDLRNEVPGMLLEINGPSTPVSLTQIKVEENTLGHDNHGEAVKAVWLWDYRGDGAKDGLYEVVLRIRNDQGTAEAVGVATFQIGDGRERVCAKNIGDERLVCTEIEPDPIDRGSPGFGIAWLLPLALLVRRR